MFQQDLLMPFQECKNVVSQGKSMNNINMNVNVQREQMS